MGNPKTPYVESTSVRLFVCDAGSLQTVCHIMQLSIGVPCQKLSSKCEFHENRHNDRFAFKEGVYEFVPNLFIDGFGSNSVQVVSA
jgi:hypothetical protein